MIRTLITFAGLILFFSCSSKQPKQPPIVDDRVLETSLTPKENFPLDSVIQSVHFVADNSQSFALYLPPSYSTTSKCPVILFFDPHGDGSLPVTKYHELARPFGYILVGSNNTKNGLSLLQTNSMAANLISEVYSRISADEKRTALAGFSGGAKVALAYAADHPEIINVIYAGATSPLQRTDPQFSLLGFAGINDMNYTNLLTFDQSLSANNHAHFLIEWNGKHEWPDTFTFENAFYWMSFNAMRNKLQETDTSMVHRFTEQQYNEMSKDHEMLTKFRILSKATYFLNGVAPTVTYSNQLAAIEKDQTYQETLLKKQQMIQQEQALKQNYYAAFRDKNLDWWQQEITRMKNKNDVALNAMYNRLLGFISLACYSMSGNAIAQNQWDTAKRMLAIYQLADPENSDQPFFEACFFAKQGETAAAMASLKRAVALGLKDPAKILNEPALSSLQSNPEFISLINSLQQ